MGSDRDDTPCGACHGTGFRLVNGGTGSAARRCECQVRLQSNQRLVAAQIPARYRHCTLDDFDLLHNASLQAALAMTRRMIDEFPGSGWGLLYLGRCGVGKTHLAAAALRALVTERGASGLFAEYARLLRRIQDSYDKRSQTPSFAVLQPALEADVLVLDDLGSMTASAWARDTLGLIINERYSANRLTILTTNLLETPPEGQESLQERVGERLLSRLSEMCHRVVMDGVDYRRQFRAAAFR